MVLCFKLWSRNVIDSLYYVIIFLIAFRDALVLGESEKEAREHFHSKLQESRKNSFYTSMNWFIHGLAKDNRQ